MSEEINNNIAGTRAILALKEDLGGIKSDFLTLHRELGAVTYQLISLYDRWAIEHQHVARREAEMTRTIEVLQQHIKDLKTLETAMPAHIQNSTSKATTLMTDTIKYEVKKTFAEGVSTFGKELSSTIRAAEEIIRKYKIIDATEQFKDDLKKVALSVLIGIVASIVTTLVYR